MEEDYNQLHEIEDLRHEIINDRKDVKHDSLFKIIVIGDSGWLPPFLTRQASARVVSSNGWSRTPSRKSTT